MTAGGPARATAGTDYWIYGVRVSSAVDLPDWPTVAAAEPEVFVRLEPVAGPDLEGPPYAARFVVEGGELRMTVLGTGRFSASSGSVILVDPDRDAKPADIRLYLTGAMMGAILHQRGTWPLHASAVALPGVRDAVGFAGRSGAGKSTLVAALVDRGASFVSDDICVMAPSDPGGLRVWPGAPRVKLDHTGLGTLPRVTSPLDAAGGDRGKFHLPMSASPPPLTPIPLGRVYLLTDGEGPPRIERLEGLDAVSALVDDTYFLTAAHALGLLGQVFRLAAKAAQALPVSRLIRPRGLEHLPALASLVAQDAMNPLS